MVGPGERTKDGWKSRGIVPVAAVVEDVEDGGGKGKGRSPEAGRPLPGRETDGLLGPSDVLGDAVP